MPDIPSIVRANPISARRTLGAAGLAGFAVLAVLSIAASAYAQGKCSDRVAAILNDPAAKTPPNFSGTWSAYECTSCDSVRAGFREYKFYIEQKEGKVTLERDLYDLKFGPVEMKDRSIAVRTAPGTLDKEGGAAMLKIEFSPDGTKFKGTVEYTTIIPGRRDIFGSLSDEDMATKRRAAFEKQRDVTGRALKLAQQCLKDYEAQIAAAAAPKPAAPLPPTGAAGKPMDPGIEESLRKLQDLYDKRLITPEEFQIRRQKLLDRI